MHFRENVKKEKKQEIKVGNAGKGKWNKKNTEVSGEANFGVGELFPPGEISSFLFYPPANRVFYHCLT